MSLVLGCLILGLLIYLLRWPIALTLMLSVCGLWIIAVLIEHHLTRLGSSLSAATVRVWSAWRE